MFARATLRSFSRFSSKKLHAIRAVSTVLPTSSIVQRSFSSKHDETEPDFFSGYEDQHLVQYPAKEAYIGEMAPDFSTKAVVDGEIVDVSLDQYIGKWVVLFFYPKDFTFVCPTEIIAFSDRAKEFEQLGAQLIACSTDTPECHLAWTRTPRNQGGLGKMQIPILADTTKVIASRYGVLQEEMGISFRGLFIIDPEGILQQITMNNFPVGRCVDESLRLLQAFQFVAEHGEVCPAGWTPGAPTIIPNPEDSQEYFAANATAEDTADDSKLVEIKSKVEFDELIKTGKPVVADFMAPWCGKCTQLLPYVEELAAENPNITFVKVDTSKTELDMLKESLGVTILPTFRFFNNGSEVGTPVVGYKKRPLASAIEKLA